MFLDQRTTDLRVPLSRSTTRHAANDEPIAIRSARARRLAPWLGAVFVVAWALLSIHRDTAQWSDNFEQFVWAHSLEWGYHKHPPFPTWLLAASMAVAGSHSWSAQALAAACIVATGLLTHAIARRLLGVRAATFALMFWGLQQPFNARATLYNHNTVMMTTVAATVWLVLRAMDPDGRSRRWWWMAGMAAGAAMLSKYQSVVPLAGIVAAVMLSGEWRRRDVRQGLVVAALVGGSVCLPHVWWMVRHAFTTLDYASQHGLRLGAVERLASMASFSAQQVRLLAPALVFTAVVSAFGRWSRGRAGRSSGQGAASSRPAGHDRRVAAWLFGLIAFPLVTTLLTSPLFGLKLQNHWGYQALQFTSLLLAYCCTRSSAVASPGASTGVDAGRTGLNSEARWLAVAAVVQAVFMMVIVVQGSRGSNRIDAGYPAQELSDAVTSDWRHATACPLRIVVGPPMEAGIVSIYETGKAAVLEDGDPAKSPWILAQALSTDGAVYIAQDPRSLPTRGVVDTGSLDVSRASQKTPQRVHWAIVPPPACSELLHANGEERSVASP